VGKRTEYMDISPYQVQYVVRAYTSQIKSKNLGAIKKLLSSSSHEDEVSLSIEGKKRQLIEQSRSQVENQIASRMQVRKFLEIDEEAFHGATFD
jgi:hypothetical protein